jgi:uncharacterized protein involved in exopolysaccharide biosynthesis
MTATDLNGEINPDVTEQSGEEGVDADQLKEIAGFVWHAARRRPKLAASVFVVVASLGLAVSVTMPRIYNSQVKLLAQRASVLPALTNPGRTLPYEADNPTSNVSANIMRRDNLVALVKEANLVERWHASRSAGLRLKDRLFNLFSAPPREEDEVRGLAQTLEKRMTVTTDESTVTISIDWSDPQVAYDLVRLVQKNFVEARYDAQVAMIQDALGVLEDHAKAELEQVDSALAAYQEARESIDSTSAPSSTDPTVRRPATVQRAPSLSAAPPAPPVPAVDPDLTKALEEKRRQIRALEDSRQRTLDTLKQQLVQAQLTLTAMHPTVIALQQKIDSLSEPPPELANLKNEERELMNQIVQSTPVPSTAPSSHPSPILGPTLDLRQTTAQKMAAKSGQQDPSLAPLRSRLDSAISRYQNVMANIDSAKLELDITRAAFRYRYSEITPAEISRAPKKPIAFLVGVASVLGGVFLAMLGAAAADWRTGRILETWQIRRRLKLEVLAEFEPPS